jgi:hypothetical protein
MTDKKSSLFAGVENGTDKGPWYEGTAGERIAVRLSSTDTNGAYAIVESVAAPGCSRQCSFTAMKRSISWCSPVLIGS